MTMRTECRSFGTSAVIALPVIFTFLSGTASADDLSLRASYQAGTDNPWSRPYVGVTVGLGTGEFVYNEGFSGGPTSSITLPGGGIRAGLRAGYDYAIGGNFLIGAIADYSITSVWSGGEISLGTTPPLTADLRDTLTSLATVRGRLGFIERNNLFYLHGGAAMGTVDITLNGEAISGIIDNPRIGYTVGAGFEYAIAENATISTEYSYTDLGAFDVFSLGDYQISDHLAFHSVTAGLNYRF